MCNSENKIKGVIKRFLKIKGVLQSLNFPNNLSTCLSGVYFNCMVVNNYIGESVEPENKIISVLKQFEYLKYIYPNI